MKTRKELDKQYELYSNGIQSHSNIQTAILVEKATPKKKLFCKVIERNDQMRGDTFRRAIDSLTTIEHPNIHRVNELFTDDHAMYLVSESLNDQYNSLTESKTFLEQDVRVIIEQILRVLCHLESNGYTMKNLHPNNIFLRFGSPRELLITDVGLGDVPGY